MTHYNISCTVSEPTRLAHTNPHQPKMHTMAKNPRNEASTTDVNAAATQPVDAQAVAATQAAATPASDERYKMVTDPETGQLTKRQDYIRKLWQEKKMKRGDIAK